MSVEQRLIIDTDPGIDDAHAIMMAWADPRVQIEAITTVAGNVSVEQGSVNALRILDLLGSLVPVYQGASDAIVVPTTHRATSHGSDGLGDVDLPRSSRSLEGEPASRALVRLANASPGELTLVALGPLTNLALALRLDPELPGKFKRLVVMGGAVHGQGNTQNPPVEFNTFVDPEAAYIVFSQWDSFTLVPWETALHHGLDSKEIQEITSSGTPEAEFFKRSISKRFIEQIPGRSAVFEPDAIAIAVAIDPNIVLEKSNKFIDVELAGMLTRGQTVVDWFSLRDYSHRSNKIEIIFQVDHDAFLRMLAMGCRRKP